MGSASPGRVGREDTHDALVRSVDDNRCSPQIARRYNPQISQIF
jgi:hypothetical protein